MILIKLLVVVLFYAIATQNTYAADTFSKDSCKSLDHFIQTNWKRDQAQVTIPKPDGKWVKDSEIQAKWKDYQASCPSNHECKEVVNSFWASLNRKFADGCSDYQVGKTISMLNAEPQGRRPASVDPE